MDLHHCHISPKSVELARLCLQSGRVSEGDRVKQFEGMLTSVCGLRNPVAVNSGTSALHLALVLAGVGPNDKVVLPPQTFIATGMAVLMCGAVPLFCDIDPWTGNIDPEDAGRRLRADYKHNINNRDERFNGPAKAIIPVHWGGLPCDLDELYQETSHNRQQLLYIIQDAAHALGATYKGEPLPQKSHFTAFSFQAVKHVSTGDGGSLCCYFKEDEEKARKARWFGLNRREEPGPSGERDCDATDLGFKYQMNDLAACVGIGNLEDFPQRLVRRQAIGKRYREELEGVKGVKLLRLDRDRTHAYWTFPLRVDRRDDFIRTLKEKSVPASVVNRRIDRYSVFGGVRDYLKGMAEFEREHVCLPCHEALTEEDVKKVIATVQEGW